MHSMYAYEPISAIPKILFYMNETQQQLDNVYKDFIEDPQKIELKESIVTTLEYL